MRIGQEPTEKELRELLKIAIIVQLEEEERKKRENDPVNKRSLCEDAEERLRKKGVK